MPNFKKIVSAICAAAILATSAIVPVMAEDTDISIAAATKVDNWDYTAGGAADDWTKNGSITGEITSDGLYLKNTSSSGSRVATKALSTEITGSAIVEYEVQMYCRGERATTVLFLGPAPNTTENTYSGIVKHNFSQGGSNSSINGISLPAMTAPASYTTPWIKVTHIINATSKRVTSEVTLEDGSVLYSGEAAYSADVAFTNIGVSLGKYNEATIKNVKVSTIDVPTITFETISNVEIGEPTKVATVTDATSIEVELSDDSNFEYIVNGTEVFVKALDSATSGDAVTVTVKGIGDVTVEGTKTVTALAASEIAQAIADEIDIENGSSVVKDGNVYSVVGGFTVPVSSGVATITWTSEDSSLAVDAEGNVTLDTATARSFVLKATVDYKGETVEKTFDITVPSIKVYYDEDFEDFATGDVVSLSNGSNTTYPGFSFSSSTRGDGGADKHYVRVVEGTHSGKYVSFVVSNYAGDRTHYVDLTNMNNVRINNQLYVSFDFMMNDDNSTLLVTAGADSLEITTDISEAVTAGNWYNLTIVSNYDNNTSTLTFKDAEGNIVDVQTLTALPKPTRIGSLGNVNENYAIDNLKIMDAKIPNVATIDVKRIAPGETLTIATISNADEKSVSVSDTTNFTCVVDDAGIVKLTAAENVADGAVAEVTITAESDLAQSVVMNVTAGTNEYFAEAIAGTVDVVGSNTTITASGTEFKASGDFTLPTEHDGAKVTWSSSDANLVSVVGKKASVYPKTAGKVTLTATVDYEGATHTKDFVIDLADYNALALRIVAAEIANTSVKYAADAKGDIYSLTLANGAVVESDVVLPSAASVTVDSTKYAVNVAWSVSENTNLTKDGVISVADKNKHAVALTKNVSYLKDGVVVATDSVTYNVDVQFNPDTLKQTITNIVNTKNSTITDEAAKYNLDKYLRAFVYDYQVRFDAALESNFVSVPTSVSTAGVITLPLTGEFGSKFVWESSDASVLNVTPSTGSVSVVLPSYAKTVTLTAKVQSETAQTKNKTVNVAVAGSGLGLVGGGGNGGGTRPSGGSSIAGGNVTPVTPSNPSTNVPNPNPSGFTDLGTVPWAVTAINNLYVNNIIEGKTATEFYPNDNITRAEFATILVKAFNIPLASVGSATFYDVPTSHWASKYIETAAAAGIVEGYDDGSFEPNTNVTRQDMAIMVKRAAEATGYKFTEKVEVTTFTDEATIAAYAKPAVLELQKAGVVSGVEGGAYAPLATSTRAQACQIIYNVFNK